MTALIKFFEQRWALVEADRATLNALKVPDDISHEEYMRRSHAIEGRHVELLALQEYAYAAERSEVAS
jgi:hypothetical protein